jgi:hypothetical protein
MPDSQQLAQQEKAEELMMAFRRINGKYSQFDWQDLGDAIKTLRVWAKTAGLDFDKEVRKNA